MRSICLKHATAQEIESCKWVIPEEEVLETVKRLEKEFITANCPVDWLEGKTLPECCKICPNSRNNTCELEGWVKKFCEVFGKEEPTKEEKEEIRKSLKEIREGKCAVL